MTPEKQPKKYKVVIPSYRREKVIQEKTLLLLLSRGIKAEDIYIFVADKQEEKLYKEALPVDSYNKIIVGKKGISHQRNFIIDYFNEGDYLIFIDDDISNIRVKRKGKITDLTDLDLFFKNSYKSLIDEKKYLWATKNMYNPFYKNIMKNYAVVGFAEFSGDFMGIINRKSMKIKYTLDAGEAEQIELLFMYYEKDGGIIKYDNVIVISVKLTPGGKVAERGSKENRIDSLLKNNKILLSAYPQYIKEINEKGDRFRKRSKIIFNQPDEPLKIIEGGKLKVEELDRDNPDNTKVFVDKIIITPKIKELQSKIVELLSNTKIPPIASGFYATSGGKKRGEIVGSKGYTFNLGGGRRRFIPTGEFSTNKQNPELFKTIVEYANLILPTGFEYSVITLNKNLQAKKHKDGGNDGLGCITFLGDYTGGGLYIYDDTDKPKLYPSKDVVIAFNGARLAHKTEPFTGDRYAMIFYQQVNKFKIKGTPMVGSGLDDYSDLKVY